MTSKQVLKQLRNLASRWPTDTVRKAQLKDDILESANRAFAAANFPKDRDLNAQETRAAQAMARSLENLLQNRAHDRFPLSEKLLQPESYPTHYEKLHFGLDRVRKAQNKESNGSFWGGLFGSKKPSL